MTSGTDWRNWRRSEWNSALIPYLFGRRQGQTQPVVRIPITPETLTRAANASQSESTDVRDCFVQSYRDMSPWRVKSLFEVPSAYAGWSPKSAESPPFVADLVLTLLVASASEQTYAQGNFRARMVLELGHAQGTFYPFSGLSALWQSLAEWLARRVRAGKTYRLLKLPDPGYEVRIGYSKRLAFPNYRDYLQLTSVLSEEELGADSPPMRILQCVLAERARFSSGFMSELSDFECLLSSGRDDLFSHPFWAAVQSITWEWQVPGTVPFSRPRYRLLLEWTDPGCPTIHLLAGNLHNSARIRATPLAYPLSSYTHMLPIPEGEEDAKSNPLGTLACLADDDRYPGFTAAPVLRSIRSCAVCFAPAETGELLSQSSLPARSAVFVAIHRVLRVEFLDRLRERGIAIQADVPIGEGDWCILGLVPAEELLALARDEVKPFADLEWIARRIEAPELHLSGACRNERFFFLRCGCIPTVMCKDSDTITCAPVSAEHTFAEFPLSALSPQHFSFAPDQLASLPRRGKIELRAFSDGDLIATRTIEIASCVTNSEFKLPTDASAWLVEAGTGHLTHCELSGSALLGSEDYRSVTPAQADSSPKFALIRHEECSTRCSPVMWMPLSSLPRDTSDLFECLAALGSARQGIAVDDIFTLLGATMKPRDYSMTWGMIRSLTENGFVHQFFSRRWCGMKFFPQQPALYVIERSDEVLLRAVGLFPELRRAALERECRRLGLAPEIPTFAGACCVGPIRIKAQDRDQCDSLSERIRLPIHIVDEASLPPAPTLSQILSSREEVLNSVVEDTVLTTWDWNYGCFSI